MKKTLSLFFIVSIAALSGCSQADDINEMSLSDSQQKTIITALQHHHLTLIEMHGGFVAKSIIVRGENASEDLVVSSNLSNLNVNAGCDDFDSFDITRNEKLHGGFSLRAYNLKKSCVSSESLTNYLVYVIDQAAELYQEELTNIKQPEENAKSYRNN